MRGLLLVAFLLAAQAAHAETFTVQVASTSSRAEAERLVALMAGRDLAAYWTEATVGGKTVYRVRVGSFPSRDAAKDFAEALPAELRESYWVAPEEAVPVPSATPNAKATAVVKATPTPKSASDADKLLAEAIAAHRGPDGGFAAVDRAASVMLSYRLKSLDAKTGAPVFTRHIYRRKGKDKLRLEITPIDSGPAAYDGNGKLIVAAGSTTVHTADGAWVEADGTRTTLAPATARARIEALGPAGMLRLPLAFPNRGAAAVGIERATVAGTRTLNGVQAIRVDATPPPKPYREASLYFDPVSHRLVAARFLTDAGELLLTFADYTPVPPDVIVPMERVVYRDGTVVSSVTIDVFALDVPMDDGLFAR